MDIQQVSAHVAKELNGFGISLHKRSVEVLIWEIEEAIADGRIRSHENQHSVFDFIRIVLVMKSERKVWERFVNNCPEVVRFCHNFKFEGAGQRETPVTDLMGLVFIAYLGSCEYSEKLRSASAAYFVESRKEKPKPLIERQAADLRQHIGELNAANKAANERINDLESQLNELLQQLKKTDDKAQYFQAKAIAGSMLDRLKSAPDEFSEDGEWVWLVSGIADKSYFTTRCKEDLQHGVDWILAGKNIKLTPQAALLMLLNFRSRRGVSTRYLPPKIELDTKRAIGSDSIKQNRRKLQSS
jgi:hypothetical protein